MTTEIATSAVTLFTYESKVNTAFITEIREKIALLQKYKPNQKMKLAGFDVDNIRYRASQQNIDTIMHLVQMYGFIKSVEGWGDYIRVNATYTYTNGYIYVPSEQIKVDILPNDVKSKIFID